MLSHGRIPGTARSPRFNQLWRRYENVRRAEHLGEILRAKTGRQCGDCSLCCKLLNIDELNKPANTWCQHCRPGKGGCSIYADRPPDCRTFACGWLTHPEFGDIWKP